MLLVEDDAQVRAATERILRKLGYVVLTAATPGDALLLCEQHDEGSIDVLLSDVVMPLMNGNVLAQRLQANHPSLRVLFMSGYAVDVKAERGSGFEEGQVLVDKPFSEEELAQTLRTVLDREATPS